MELSLILPELTAGRGLSHIEARFSAWVIGATIGARHSQRPVARHEQAWPFRSKLQLATFPD